MRKYGILLILGAALAFIAFQARTGIFRSRHPGEPANIYMRQVMAGTTLTEQDATLIREQYGTSHLNPSGLRYLMRRPGKGAPAKAGDEVTVNYDGYLLLGGKKIDSSRDRHEPLTVRLGTGAVIKGWDEALVGMKPGEQRTLIIPWWLAYGDAGRGPIPPRATLRFELELLEIR